MQRRANIERPTRNLKAQILKTKISFVIEKKTKSNISRQALPVYYLNFKENTLNKSKLPNFKNRIGIKKYIS